MVEFFKDSIKIEKLDAMEKYRMGQFLPMLFQFSLRFILFGLFLSSPFWLPTICCHTKLFFLVTLPKIRTILSGSKCVFIVSNLIIIFLVGESKLSRTSPQPDVYEEYVVRSQDLRRAVGDRVTGKETTDAKPLVEESAEDEAYKVEETSADDTEEKDEKEVEKEEEEEECGGEEEVEMVEECEELDADCEEEKGLPAEELNRKVEDFIAKVNMQRKLEERMLVCCG